MSWGKNLWRPEDLPLKSSAAARRLRRYVSRLMTSTGRWYVHLTRRQRRTRGERLAHVRKVGRWGWR